MRILKATAVIIFSLCANLSSVEAQPNSSLAFVESNQTQKHIAIQPRSGFHRVHFWVRAKDLKDVRCEAQILCTEGDLGLSPELVHKDTAYFTPSTNNQLLSFHLRTPKIIDQNLQYILLIEPSSPFDEKYHAGAGFSWKIERDGSGKAKIIPQKPGQELIFTSRVGAAVPGSPQTPESITIVFETKTTSLTAPEGLKFGVDSSGQYEIDRVVKPLN